MAKTVLGVLASGRGSNLQAILDAIDANQIRAEVGVVISDKPTAAALVRAKEHGIPAVCIDRKQFDSRAEFGKALAEVIEKHQVDLVVLAGFMRILDPDFIRLFSGRIMNIHPALLPSFQGLNAQQQAIDYGVRLSGCTVHFVDEGTDTGPIILQEAVPVMPDDTADSLAERILVVEHRLYPQAIALYCDGRLLSDGRKVTILSKEEQ
ncbi:Phosphoribosylglycinamide formyltransferase [bioreactor metagenome]|uniref:phosphoribosylglycinamide formyltransferase 1 n=1 Tax=bioreactor metagenome TaxID=1076179 RepID=A0A644TG29_9ZZZZ|nr:phosphoribosylglycinamide formyltransferase [Negativicutes bacterium]